ncbi:hypothetical protein Hanom_Chr12g01075121 [Helianthus anomalus]
MFFRNVLILLFNFKIKWVLGSLRACLVMFFETTYRLIGVLEKSIWSDLLTFSSHIHPYCETSFSL